MGYRTRNILAATVLALLAVVFMVVYISKARSGSGKTAKTALVPVLVASHDIPAGTLGVDLASGAFVTKQVPPDAAVPDRIADPAQVRGQIVTQDILSGEQASTRRFGPLAAVGVRAVISRAQRVVQLEGDASQVLDGTLKPGDRVDVLATWNSPEKCGQCHVSRMIVRNALVLKTSAELGAPAGSQNTTTPVQLRLTDAQSARVFWIVKNGAWWLALRPPAHPQDSRDRFQTSHTILGGTSG